MYDIIIIGGGIAGVTAAIYARRANKSVLILEGSAIGGQLLQTEKIENYPGFSSISGKELSEKSKSQAKSLGAKFVLESVKSLRYPSSHYTFRKKLGNENFSITFSRLSKKTSDSPLFEIITDACELSKAELKDPKFKIPENTAGIYHAKSVIIATGTTCRKLNLENEDELIGKGISFCASCDGPLYKDGTVAVFGGGNSAAYSALYLSSICKKVYLIHRRKSFRADETLVDQLNSTKNIELVLDDTIKSLKGSKKLSGVVLNSGKSLKLDALFVNIGRVPELNFIDEDLDLNVTKDNFIKIKSNGETNLEGIFAAGDCTNTPVHQIVTSAAAGATAATSAINFLNTEKNPKSKA